MSAGAQHGTEVWYDLQIKKKNSKPTNYCYYMLQ